MQIETILSQIDLGAMALPEFQRGYVWNRDQVRRLMLSLYRRYPVGSLLVWVTRTDSAAAKGDAQLQPGYVKLLLDGQQRMTSLYGIVRGTPPPFFDGNPTAFTGLYFHLEDETFEFYAPLKMKDNPLWIDVTELMQNGVAPAIAQLFSDPALAAHPKRYIERLNAIHGILKIDLHIEEVSGTDKTVDIVVEIFNNVNSGGTKLSKGDLALAKICAAWPEARNEMKATLARWAQARYDFELDWLLRNINTIVTGEALFSALKDVTVPAFEDGLRQAEAAVNYLLNMIAGRLGLDHDRVLGGRYAFPVMSRYLMQRGGKLKDVHEQNHLLYWYIHSFLWGRFTGSTESVINQDLRITDVLDDGTLDRLIEQLRRWRGDLVVRPTDFSGFGLGARFYPLLYLLTRVYGARDWGTGLPLSANLLGKLSTLQVHHIFPRALLYKHGYNRAEVNSLANFCFLTQTTNLDISDTPPAIYFAQVEAMQPGALASQWAPLDRALWQIDRYRDFLKARQELLANAANTYLEQLLTGAVATTTANYATAISARPAVVTEELAEEEEIRQLGAWMAERQLPAPELDYEIADPDTGAVRAIIDAAWPKGIQEGYSQPVALLLNEEKSTETQVSEAGYRYFTTTAALRSYVENEIERVPTHMLVALAS
ncbi:MAG TPA: DUF262 domain-containing protein [Thermomicrobiales bacterium]|nr:DUF262 domain-containing protein [Thermomicrobiales bacterium]